MYVCVITRLFVVFLFFFVCVLFRVPQCTPALCSETSSCRAASTFPDTGYVSMPTSSARTSRCGQLTLRTFTVTHRHLWRVVRLTPGPPKTSHLVHPTSTHLMIPSVRNHAVSHSQISSPHTADRVKRSSVSEIFQS